MILRFFSIAVLKVLASVALLIGCPNNNARAQIRFPGSELAFHSDLYEALDEAIEEHQGDIFILFYNSEDGIASRILVNAFQEEETIQYLEENYALAAVKIGSAEWSRLQRKYRPGSEANWSHVLIDVRRYMSHAEFHGWENGSGVIDVLTVLRLMKEQGAVQGNVSDWSESN